MRPPSAPPHGERADRPEADGGAISVVDRIAERDAERATSARMAILRQIAWVAAGLLAVAAIVWAVFFSPLLALDPARVTLTGAGTTIDVDQVRAEIDPERGVPLPRLDTVALRERVLELNGVKDVRIMRDWPRGLSVELTSREPVVAVPDGSRFVLLDAEAVRVGTADTPGGVPVIKAPLADDDVSRAALFAALDVTAALPKHLAEQTTEVTADTQDDVRTHLTGGTVIIWGNGERLELKARVAALLRETAPDAGTIDVSAPDLPVTR